MQITKKLTGWWSPTARATHKSGHTIRLATPSDKPTILALVQEMAPHLDAERRWQWVYEGNPQGRALTWLATDDATGQVAGLTSYFPFKIWVERRVLTGAVGGDGFVLPRFRRRGIAGALHAAARRQMPLFGIELMYGAPTEANIGPLEAGGSQKVGNVVRYLRPLVAAVPRGSLRNKLGKLLFDPANGPARLEPATCPDPRIDRVWLATRPELRNATVRDAAFYAWRFSLSPSQRQLPFVVVRRGQPIGACAIERVGNRARIVDLLAPRNDWGDVLNAIARHERDLCGIEIKLMADDGRARRLWRFGFLEREAKPFLAVLPDGTSLASALLDRRRWFYTHADADMDTLVEPT